MRDIKFRAIELDTNAWRYGSYVKEDGFWMVDGEPDYSRPVVRHYICENGNYFDVSIDTLGQFVKVDREGNDVYEGDIYWNGKEEFQPMTIKYSLKSCSFVLCGCDDFDVEDIYTLHYQEYSLYGNAHQNPELLGSP